MESRGKNPDASLTKPPNVKGGTRRVFPDQAGDSISASVPSTDRNADMNETMDPADVACTPAGTTICRHRNY